MATFTLRVLTAGLSEASRNIVDERIRSLGAVYVRKIFPYFSESPSQEGKSPSEIHYVLGDDGQETEAKLRSQVHSTVSSAVAAPVAILVRRDDDPLGLGIPLGAELRSLLTLGEGFPSIIDLTENEIGWIATWSGDDGEPGGRFHNHKVIQHYLLKTGEGENSWERLSAMLRERRTQLVG